MPNRGCIHDEIPAKQNKQQYTLSEDDAERIKTIIESALHAKLSNREAHECRFESVKPEDLEEAVKFYRKINEALDDSKSVVRRTIITLIVGGISVLIGAGFLVNIKKTVGM